MQRIVPITFAVALLAAVVPTGTATWSSNGDSEPSTRYDTASLMFQDPPTAGKKIFFNGFAVEYLVGPNPNVGALETRNEVPGVETMYAMLGMWVDCNGDGYVGLAETAAREYDAALLSLSAVGTTICPPITGDIDQWDGQSHNYNGWVSELIPIGNNDAVDGFNTRMFIDPAVMIWADNSRPEQPSTTGGGNCPGNPQPRGTFQSTGGFLTYADCSTGLMEAMNLPWSDRFRVGGQEIEGAGDVAGLRFPNDDDARGHPVWDRPTLGGEDRSDSAVYLADCDADPLLYSGDFLNDTSPGSYETVRAVPLINWNTVYNVTVYAVPSNPVANDPASATIPATYNETTNDCDYEDDTEGNFYGQFEDEVAPTRQFGKQKAGFNFEWTASDSRGHDVREDLLDDDQDVLGLGNDEGYEVDVRSPYHPGTAGVPLFGGVRPFPYYSSEWWGGTNLIKGAPNTVATRINLGEGTADPGADEAYWLSFYAFVGSNTTDKGLSLPGGSGIYGQAQCGGNTDGIHNGWDCNAANWNLDTEGQPVTSTHDLATVGDVYNLRDVDCQDGGNNLGVGLGVPFYGAEACSSFV